MMLLYLVRAFHFLFSFHGVCASVRARVCIKYIVGREYLFQLRWSVKSSRSDTNLIWHQCMDA